MHGQFNTEEERNKFLWEVTRLLVYSKYQHLLADNIKEVEAHWFYCYGSRKLTLKVVHKQETRSSSYEVLAQDPAVQQIAEKCFSCEEMFVEHIAVDSVPHFEILTGAQRLKTLLEGE